jgi:hypothetical protein
MIHKVKSQNSRRRVKPRRNFIVFCRTFKLPGRVIVRDAKSRGSVLDNVGEYFPWVNNGFVYKTDGYNPYRQHFVRAVQGKTDKAFLLAVGVVSDKRKNINRLLNAG